MTADIVNLRRARKAKARAERAKDADANRVRFGRTKAERTSSEAIHRIDDSRHDGHRLAPGASGPPDAKPTEPDRRS